MTKKDTSKDIKGRLVFKEDAFQARNQARPTKPARDHKMQKRGLLSRLWSSIKAFLKPQTNWDTKKKTRGPISNSVAYKDFNPTAQDIAMHKHTEKIKTAAPVAYKNFDPKAQDTTAATTKPKHTTLKNQPQQKGRNNKPTNNASKITIRTSSKRGLAGKINKRAKV